MIFTFSHKVPDPFLNTSSAFMGIIVPNAKMKSCICILYRWYVATASETEYSANFYGSVRAIGSIYSGSTSIGSYLSLALVTAFKPWLPLGRYESL